jgi:sugar lactone lactonase YvrE
VRARSAIRELTSGHGLLESPRWRDERLFVSDMALGRVLSIGLDGSVDAVCEVPGSPSGIGWLPDGRMLVVSMHGRRVLAWDGVRLSTYADLNGVVDHDINDMVVDASGRAYVSNFGYEAASGVEPVPTGLVLVDVDGSVSMQPRELFRPNGMVITPDGRTLIVAETRVHRLTAFSIGTDGSLRQPREFATLPRGGWSDGIGLDAEGAVWVADPKARACRRVLEGGEVSDVVDTAPDATLACMLGGRDGRTLFMTVAPDLRFEQARRSHEGRVLTVDVDVPHAGHP